LQRAHHVHVLTEQLDGLGHGQLQHVGDAELLVQPLDLHLAHLGAEARAVAIGAAQVHVTEELHLDVFEARAAAGRAAPVASVEAEGARCVAAFARQRRHREQRAHRVEGADVAGRVRARRLADGRLVHEADRTQPVGAQQVVVLAGALGGFAEVAQQGGVQDVLDQGGFARSTDACHAHQPLQGKVYVQVLEVVLARALQDELGRVVLHRTALADPDAAARTQVGTGQRLGVLEVLGRAVENDAAALRAGAGAHVDDAVGCQHHGGVVLDHHQRVACVHQALHGQVDAVHVARVQADGRLIEHEQRVDQRGAQGGGQGDALHLAARERLALPVEREVAQADIDQVLQARADLVEQQLQGFLIALVGQRDETEEALQLRDGQQHQVVHVQAGQGAEGRSVQRHALGLESLRRSQHRVGIGLRAQAPQQGFGLQARAFAVGAGRVAAVLRQEHADVHLVGLAFEVAEEAADAVPLLVPVALPVGVAFEHPVLLLGGELRPGRVARDGSVAGVLDEVGLALGPGGRLQRLDGAAAQRLLGVGDDQAPVHADDAAEAPARGAGARRRVEREHAGRGRAVAAVAFGAVQAAGEAPQLGLSLVVAQRVDRDVAVAALEGDFERLDDAGAVEVGAAGVGPHAEAVDRDIEHQAFAFTQRGQACVSGGGRFFRRLLGSGFLGRLLGHGRGTGIGRDLHHPLRLDARETAGRQPLLHLLGRGVGGQLGTEGDHHAPTALGHRAAAQQRLEHRLRRVLLHGQAGGLVEQAGGAREQQLEVVVELRHRAHRGARGAHRVGLVDGDRRRHAFDAVHRRAVHAVEELAGVGAEGLDVAALALGVEGVEHQRGLARTAGAGHHGELPCPDIQVEVLEVVLAGAADADVGHARDLHKVHERQGANILETGSSPCLSPC